VPAHQYLESAKEADSTDFSYHLWVLGAGFRHPAAAAGLDLAVVAQASVAEVSLGSVARTET
jgi:hypothetical protein